MVKQGYRMVTVTTDSTVVRIGFAEELAVVRGQLVPDDRWCADVSSFGRHDTAGPAKGRDPQQRQPRLRHDTVER